MKRVMVKDGNHWILGTDQAGKHAFDQATARSVLRSAQAHGHAAYIADIGKQTGGDLEAELRAAGIKWVEWSVQHEPDIHYPPNDVRTQGIPDSDHLPQTVDCSQHYEWMCRLAGLPDPSGRNWARDDYTGTLLAGMKQITRAEVKPFDVIIYGAGTGEHVAIVHHIIPSGDFMMVSHGQEKGPFYITNSQEWTAHGNGPVRYLTQPRWVKAA